MRASLNSETRLYNLSIPIVGLTGGIATGKSTVSKMLLESGQPLICADSLVKEIYKSEEAISFIRELTPEAVQNGEIVFKVLREKFFNSASLKLKIEAFIYSQIELHFLKELEKFPLAEYVIYDAPVLFEKDLDKLVDTTICVYAGRGIQLKRLIKRDNIPEELANKILNDQMDIEDKKRRSDIVVHNVSNFEHLQKEVSNLITKL